MKNKKVMVISIAAVLLVILAGILIYKFGPFGKNYVATVNGEKVSAGEFKFMLDGIKSQMQDQGIKDFNKEIGGVKAIDLAKERALESIIDYKIGAQRAKLQGITLKDQDIKSSNDSVDKIIAQNAKLKDSVAKAGLSIDELKKINLELNVANRLKQQVYSNIQKSNSTISDQEAKDYYNKNTDMYTADQDMVRVRQILISTVDDKQNPLPESQQAEAKKKAEEVLAKAKAGEDFAALAKQYSEDPGSKDNGGEYTFPRGQMVKEFEDTAFSLKPGEISGLVKTQYGYHIIKLEEKFSKGQVMSFGAVKDQVKLDAQYDKMMEVWKKQSTIIKNDEVYNSIK